MNNKNYCVSNIRKTKKGFYGNLNPNLITGNRKVLKHVKPIFSDKAPIYNTITLIEGHELILLLVLKYCAHSHCIWNEIC